MAKAVVNGMAGLVFLVSGVAVAGCRVSDELVPNPRYEVTTSGDNKTLAVTGGVAQFSFDYSSLYQADRITINEDATTVWLYGPSQYGKERNAVTISIFVQKSNGATFLSDLEHQLQRARGIKDFLLLERSPVEVAGFQGERIRYSYEVPISSTAIRQGFKPLPGITSEVFFSGSSLRWSIRLFYYVTNAEASEGYEKDLRQILTTLRIEN